MRCGDFSRLYFKLIRDATTVEIVGHRIVWSFAFLVILLALRKEWSRLIHSIQGPKFLLAFLISSILIGLNWLLFVYGVNSGYIVESSLGYFINPLVSVLLGVLFLHERLRKAQWAAVGLAALGVAYLTFNYGRLPWIALGLALTFGLYGLAKKTAPLGSFYGLTLETGILFLPTLIYLLFLQANGQSSFGTISPQMSLMLAMLGPLTAIPLLAFGAAAQRIDLSMLGLLQYIAPTIQFLIGVLIFKEEFTTQSLIGFCIIWTALIVLWSEGFITRRRMRAAENSIRASQIS